MPRPDDDDAQAVALLDRIIGADPDNAGVRAQLQGTMWASPRLLLTAIHLLPGLREPLPRRRARRGLEQARRHRARQGEAGDPRPQGEAGRGGSGY